MQDQARLPQNPASPWSTSRMLGDLPRTPPRAGNCGDDQTTRNHDPDRMIRSVKAVVADNGRFSAD